MTFIETVLAIHRYDKINSLKRLSAWRLYLDKFNQVAGAVSYET